MNREGVSNVVNPSMIVLARESRGLTQSELASKLKIGQGHLSKIENGLLDISDNILSDLAKILHYPKKFFFKNAQVYPPGLAFYRKYKTLHKKVQCKICAMANMSRLHVERMILSVDIERNNIPNCDLVEYETAENVASALREYWTIPYGPIKNMIRVIEDAGVIVKLADIGTKAFSGMSMPASEVYYLILINENMPWDRIRWTIAHELGHIVMHKLPTPNMEEEADQFASEFLMPASVIRSELTDLSLVKLADLKPRWKVSMAAILRRALTLNTITERQYRYFWMRMSSLGWKTREPVELDVPAEPPSLIREFISVHFDDFNYSPEELCQVLDVEEDEFLQLYRTQLPKMPVPRLKLLKGGNRQAVG